VVHASVLHMVWCPLRSCHSGKLSEVGEESCQEVPEQSYVLEAARSPCPNKLSRPNFVAPKFPIDNFSEVGGGAGSFATLPPVFNPLTFRNTLDLWCFRFPSTYAHPPPISNAHIRPPSTDWGGGNAALIRGGPLLLEDIFIISCQKASPSTDRHVGPNPDSSPTPFPTGPFSIPQSNSSEGILKVGFRYLFSMFAFYSPSNTLGVREGSFPSDSNPANTFFSTRVVHKHRSLMLF